ncbi:MAG TPA: FAD:protein FMN transferase [Pirellulales bacterium]|nr:FAD:protein FMN transferase [Pirellulales bacterium]
MPNPRRSNRRQFLKGQAAAQALGDLVAPADAEVDQPTTAAAAETYLLQFGRRAMACQFEVYLNAGQYPQAADIALEALDFVDRLEEQMTVYRDTSEISRLNRLAGDVPVEVEPRLFQLLLRAAQIYRETDGAFDITSGSLTKVWGFYRRAGTIPEADALAEALRRVGSDSIEFDEGNRTFRFLKPGMEVNLGAIGKGYALDRVAEQMLSGGIDHFLWHGGQSSLLARGTCGRQTDDPGGWTVDVRHPLRPERSVVEICLRDRAVGTSGAGTQFFRHAGRRYGHILDPRTGWPAEGVYSATVIASTAADADALATALYVLGAERAAAWCGKHPEIGLLMFVAGQSGRSVDLVTCGLSPGDWRQVSEL